MTAAANDLIDIAAVRAAATRIAGEVIETPCLPSRTLSALTGCDVFLKFENLQFTASFKERGALNKMAQLTAAERANGVLAVSAGNHAQGVAYHAQRMGIPATIVMPRFAPGVKVERTRGFGATVVLEGDTFDDARAHGLALAQQRGLTVVHPYDDLAVMAGQGTIALEMLAQQPTIDTLVVAIGGGGLISGMAAAARAIKPGIEVIGVQTERFPSAWNAVHGREQPIGQATIADGIAVKSPGALTLPVIRSLVADVLLVSEDDIEQAILMLLEIEKTVVEGAGAAGLAALLAYPERFAGKTVGIVLCGGNIDTRLLANVLLRDLARSGRLARLRIKLQDRPGALYNVARIFDQEQVNIIEVYHQRVFSTLPAKGLITDIECETRDAAHLARLMAALEVEGYDASPVELA
jgi:threonine dehydratase